MVLNVPPLLIKLNKKFLAVPSLNPNSPSPAQVWVKVDEEGTEAQAVELRSPEVIIRPIQF